MLKTVTLTRLTRWLTSNDGKEDPYFRLGLLGESQRRHRYEIPMFQKIAGGTRKKLRKLREKPKRAFYSSKEAVVFLDQSRSPLETSCDPTVATPSAPVGHVGESNETRKTEAHQELPRDRAVFTGLFGFVGLTRMLTLYSKNAAVWIRFARHTSSPAGTAFARMKGEPGAQRFALRTVLQYFDTHGELVMRDNNHSGMAKRLITQPDFDTCFHPGWYKRYSAMRPERHRAERRCGPASATYATHSPTHVERRRGNFHGSGIACCSPSNVSTDFGRA